MINNSQYYVKVYNYIYTQLSKYIKNSIARKFITLFGITIIATIRFFSKIHIKLIYYTILILITIYCLYNYTLTIFFTPWISILLLIAIVPFIGELIIIFLTILNLSEKTPYIIMLIRGVKISTKLRSCGFPVFIGRNVRIYQPDKVSIGSYVSIYDGVIISAGKGEVIIGDHTHIDAYSVIRGDGGVYIGNYCAIASGVKIYSISNQAKEKNKKIIEQPLLLAPVVIEDDVWIGANSVILPGVRVKRGAVIGAGAVVPANRVLEEYTIYVGVPARQLKKRGE